MADDTLCTYGYKIYRTFSHKGSIYSGVFFYDWETRQSNQTNMGVCVW